MAVTDERSRQQSLYIVLIRLTFSDEDKAGTCDFVVRLSACFVVKKLQYYAIVVCNLVFPVS